LKKEGTAPTGIDSAFVELWFYERKADGYNDETWGVMISREGKFMEYTPKFGLYGVTEDDFRKNLGKSERVNPDRFQNQGNPLVTFTALNVEECGCVTGQQENVNLYWFEPIQRWVAISYYHLFEHNHNNPISECHSGPYEVQGIIAEKLLEAYGIKTESIAGKDISRRSPSDLEKMANR
jgi:hypothetical protein